MKKRFLALVLSAAMVMGMGLTAFAAEVEKDTSGSYTTTLEGVSSTQLPTIKVTVPSNLGDIIINPYKMEASVSGGDAVKDQVISVPATITNESEVAVRVDVTELTAVANTGSKVVFATAAYKDDAAQAKDTKKTVFAWVEFVKGDADFATAYDKSKTNMIVLSKKASLTNAVTLDAGDQTAQTAKFKISGQAATAPTELWADTDTFTVTMKFTFTPQVNAE